MNDNAYQNFTELELWKKTRDFKNQILGLTKIFPQEEKYRLTDQIIRSSRSINATLRKGMEDLHIKIKFTFAFRQEVH